MGEVVRLCRVMYEGGSINTAAVYLKPASFSRQPHSIPLFIPLSDVTVIPISLYLLALYSGDYSSTYLFLARFTISVSSGTVWWNDVHIRVPEK